MSDNVQPTFPVGKDPYVIIRGGLVQNDPALPVIDLDVIESEFPNRKDAWFARVTAIEARRLGLADYADELDQFAAWVEEGDHGC